MGGTTASDPSIRPQPTSRSGPGAVVSRVTLEMSLAFTFAAVSVGNVARQTAATPAPGAGAKDVPEMGSQSPGGVVVSRLVKTFSPAATRVTSPTVGPNRDAMPAVRSLKRPVPVTPQAPTMSDPLTSGGTRGIADNG